MKAVTVTFIVPDDEAEVLEGAIEDSQLLNDWPVVEWTTEESKTWQDNRYRDES